MSQQRRSSRSSRSSVDQPSPGHVLTRNTGPLITTNVFIAFSSLGSSSYPKKLVSTLRSSDAEGFILTFNDHMWQNSSDERIFTVSNKLFSILGQRAAAASLSVLSWDSRNKKKTRRGTCDTWGRCLNPTIRIFSLPMPSRKCSTTHGIWNWKIKLRLFHGSGSSCAFTKSKALLALW